MKFWMIILLIALTSISSLRAEEIRICAIRVEFQPDNNSLTTGNGFFMVDSVTQDKFAIDPAPHNKLYFEDQILAASNYFNKVSRGKVTVTGDVFPLADNGAYQLSNKMGHYSPNTTDEENNLGLANLFTESIEAAKNGSDNIDFSQYNLFVIFHAGVGKDVDLGYDPTPQDIPSLFITEDFLKNSLGESFSGVDVGTSSPVTQGIILPETENQDDVQIALTGMFVSNIGSYLGLYDLFSPSEQSTGIGSFGLMDVGLINTRGLIPSPPNAFSRKLLGWDSVLVVEKPQSQIEVKRLGSTAEKEAATIIQIPINEDEYYLVEYRGWKDKDLDSLYSVLAESREDIPSYLEMLEAFYGNRITRGESGVLVSVPDYDWGIPGCGLLIWHVDERIIAEKAATRNINDDPDLRAVDLEEADGAQDIGHEYTILDYGYYENVGSGWFADFWYSSNPAFDSSRKLEFSNTSSPNTRANRNQAVSHIKLDNFSNNIADVMRFDFTRDWFEENFPVSLTEEKADYVDAIAGTVHGSNHPYYFVLNNLGQLYTLNANGEGLSQASNALFADLHSISSKPYLALNDLNSDGQNDLLIAAAGDSLYGFYLNTALGSDFVSGLTSTISTPPVFQNSRIYVGCIDGSVTEFDLTGTVQNTYTNRGTASGALLVTASAEVLALSNDPKFAALAPLNSNNTNLISFAESVTVSNLQTSELLANWTAEVDPVGPPAIVDVDNNGVYDIVVAQADGIYAFNYLGNPLNGFPVKPDLSDNEVIVGSPLIFDVDNDEVLDFVVASNIGSIFALNSQQQFVSGFPLSVGGELNSAPQLIQFDEDEAMELLVVNKEGSVYNWQLDVTESSSLLHWTKAYGNNSNNLRVDEVLSPVEVGSELMPSKRVYNYPNPNIGDITKIRYYLNEEAIVKIRIFDAAGTPVDDFEGPGVANTDNEVEWNVSNIASGLYLCQVKAKGSSSSSSKIIKIMVVH